MRNVQPGSTDVSVRLMALDSSTFAPETGIAYNTSGIALWYQRDRAAKVAITPASLAADTTAHTDGGVRHISDGMFRLDVPDAAFAYGVDTVAIGGSATGMVIPPIEIQITGTLQPLRAGVLAGGGASTATLDAGASSGNGFYGLQQLVIIAGTGAGQARIITDYVGSTKVATVDQAWATNPASGSVYAIFPLGIAGMTSTQVAGAILNATATSYDAAGSIGEKINDSGAAATPPTKEEIAAEIFDTPVATGVTYGDKCRGDIAVLYGVTNVNGADIEYRNKENTKNAVVITVNNDKERTSVALNLTQ